MEQVDLERVSTIIPRKNGRKSVREKFISKKFFTTSRAFFRVCPATVCILFDCTRYISAFTLSYAVKWNISMSHCQLLIFFSLAKSWRRSWSSNSKCNDQHWIQTTQKNIDCSVKRKFYHWPAILRFFTSTLHGICDLSVKVAFLSNCLWCNMFQKCIPPTWTLDTRFFFFGKGFTSSKRLKKKKIRWRCVRLNSTSRSLIRNNAANKV